jgi:hypothetical protein
MPITPGYSERLQEAFSLALEDRSSGYVDLVTNSNAILFMMKQRDMFTTFSGPTIRERLLYGESGTYTRYSGLEFLNPKTADLFTDAEFEPKMAAVSIVLSNEDILKNSGPSQLKDIFKAHMSAAEDELVDRFVEDLHSDGTAAKQIGGLQLAIPTNPATGTYGGIDRAVATQWRTRTFDVQTDFGATITQFNAASSQKVMQQVVIQMSRGNKGPNVFCMAAEHYQAYTDSLTTIQRINDENGVGKGGFTSLKFYGAGKTMDVVLEGGIGSAMPSNVTYVIDTSALGFRYHPERNFSKIGKTQMPVNQDGVVQHVGFMGNLILKNPLHTAKIRDSNPAA